MASDAAVDVGITGRPFVYASGSGSDIVIFSLDPTSGALTPRGLAPAGESASFLAWDPAARHLFAVNETSPGRVVSFAIDRASGGLSRINDVPSGGEGPAHLSVDPSGRWVLVANYAAQAEGVVAALAIGDDGRLSPATAAGTHSFGTDALPHLIVTDPTGSFVLVPCKGRDRVGQLRFDAASGALAPNAPAAAAAAAAPGAGPRHLVFHPNGRRAYVINELDSTMVAYDYDAASGTLARAQALSTLPAAWAGDNTAAGVHVHPGGRFLYGSNRGHDSIVIYALDDAGRMTLVGHETGGGLVSGPRCFHIEASGRFLLVANQGGAGGLLVFRIDPATGRLTRLGGTTPAGSPAFVGVIYLP